MHIKLSLFALAALWPILSWAQGLQEYIPSLVNFLFGVVLPFLIGASFLVVAINVIRYFVIEITNPEGREKAKSYVIYSILAFVFISTFVGIVDILTDSSGLESAPTPSPDYYDAFED